MDEERPTRALYDEDFYGWTQEQAQLLRTLQLRGIDTDNLAEEIETLGRSERRALRSSLRLVVMHLLKAIHQPEKASKSWRDTIIRERLNIEDCFAENPSLKAELSALFVQAYDDARELAISETGLPGSDFPAQFEVTVEQVRDRGFLPPALR